MGKISIQELAATLIERNGLSKKEATTFISALFDLVQQTLETEKIVKIKGLGTFKIIDVDDRESVNVNTGERVLIESHGKITFTPDPIMKELVNKPFSQFETVVLNDGVDFDDLPPELADAVEESVKPVSQTEPEPQVLEQEPEDSIPEPEPSKDETSEESSAMPLVNFVDENQEDDEDIPEWVIEPEVLPEAKVVPEPEPEPEIISEPEQKYESEPVPEPIPEPVPGVEPVSEPEPVSDVLEEEQEVASEEEEQEFEEEEERSGISKWLIALLFSFLGLIGGYVIGSYFPLTNYICHRDEAQIEEVEPVNKTVIAPVKKESPVVDSEQSSEANKAEADVEKIPEKEVIEPKPEVKPEALTPKPEEKKPVVTDPVPTELDKYSAMDARVRTGAYRIVGTEKVVKVKEGDNLLKISRSILGPDMECYLEVYNGIKASTVLKPGQEIKIPKLQLKKKKKAQTANE